MMSTPETQPQTPPTSADPDASVSAATPTNQDPYFSRDFSSLITLATSLELLLTRWTQTAVSAPTPPPLAEISDATQALHRLTSIRKTILTLNAWLQQPPPAPPEENTQRKEEQARQREHLRRISADVTILEESLKADLALWRMRETYPAANHFPPMLEYPPGRAPTDLEIKALKSSTTFPPMKRAIPSAPVAPPRSSNEQPLRDLRGSASASPAANSPIRTVPTAPLCPTISASFPRSSASPRGSVSLPSQEPLRVEQPSQFSPHDKSNPPTPRSAAPKTPTAFTAPNRASHSVRAAGHASHEEQALRDLRGLCSAVKSPARHDQPLRALRGSASPSADP